ncbi:MAG: hypothetical protein J7647_04990 [Cyanobacteria bacterium SBLK]|nr:hypothetical protein [Cyanobacteria bacterium SBLK]
MTTATALKLNPTDLELVAKVATRDLCHNTAIAASDIRAVTLREGMVDIYFTEGGKTIVPIAQFKAWIAEYKAQSQLSEEQQEILEVAIASPFQSEIDFQNAIASFYLDESRFVGTVRKDCHLWTAIAESTTTVHESAEEAVRSLITRTDEK